MAILEVALRLHGEQSATLTPKILESTDINDQLLAHKYTGSVSSLGGRESDISMHWNYQRYLVQVCP